jgi:hypothetical protein
VPPRLFLKVLLLPLEHRLKRGAHFFVPLEDAEKTVAINQPKLAVFDGLDVDQCGDWLGIVRVLQ